MFSNLKKVLVVAGVALVLPVLGASSAHADSGNGNGKSESKGSASQDVRQDAPADAAPQGDRSRGKEKDSKDTAGRPATSENGKGSETDKSGSSANPDGTFQGKGTSTPDQDGKGMDRGADNNDKTGPGTDGNNGCGNEPRLAAPRDGGRPTDDDNNGWCGSKPKPVKKAQPVQAAPAAPVEVSRPAAPVAAPRAAAPTSGVTQVATTTTRTAPVAAPVRQAAPAARPVARKAPVQVAGAVTTAGAGTVVVMGPPTGLAGSGSVVAQSAVAPQALPFTGAPVGLLALLAALAVGLGAFLTVAARRTA